MKPSEHFMRMAGVIDKNEAEFGGAFVIVPPNLGGEPVARMVVNVSSDASSTAVHFWGLVQAEIKTVLDKLQDQERMGAFGGRR